jgi:hypothetical protein
MAMGLRRLKVLGKVQKGRKTKINQKKCIRRRRRRRRRRNAWF